MSRSLTNFLLLETIFDEISPLNAKVYAFANKVLTPSFRIVSEDCGTKAGRVIKLGQDAVGRVSLFTYGTFEYQSALGTIEETIEDGDILTESQVTALLTTYPVVATRSVSTCTEVGGLCRKCIFGSYTEEYPAIGDVPSVGDTFKVTTDNKRNFLTYLASTHAGGLMGMEPLQVEGDALLPVREELIRLRIQDGEIPQIFREVSKVPSVDGKLIEYARDMDDKLHKSLFLILLYGVFINVKI